ncbi:hypothetical protein OUZ56_022771 [Daphnia magna]|uniref:Uncharacterized protein n=1 Tax=Daphnia magna TaxID=35525 RepID=A0ABR0AXE5_9CRUS|nr:hypothetical protein OUZ56_022771 [Daphnia magna]
MAHGVYVILIASATVDFPTTLSNNVDEASHLFLFVFFWTYCVMTLSSFPGPLISQQVPSSSIDI